MEQNSSHSTRIPKSGSISFGRSKANCLIRSISVYGAALDIAGNEKIPDEFALTVMPDGDPRRCSVVWRKEKRIAVAFY
ncbi:MULTISPECIES: PilZ domain-containing protein [unclassified Bradyrhizobium]|uniref:PilZ domain-containing protein n=1 Tax=unclassified Bradyrhizobium TaxID=2631580 RepID=UPI001FF95BA4|nr:MULTISPECIES: PilZ domain-containing protein [unclassified Bradyrhizobium]MCK1521224.1 PilZ domain-containing protein [Bradyrhizobium sp. 17]MCK1687907.1 PilZ domain-containing protein [Bradyrhizobium sp. 145]